MAKYTQEISIIMVKKEIQAQVFSIPIYLFKIILRRILRVRVTPYRVVNFEKSGGVVFNKESQSAQKDLNCRPVNSDYLDDYTKAKLNYKVIKTETIYRILKLKNLKILSEEGIVTNSKNQIVLDNYYTRPTQGNKIDKTGYISIKYHVQFMIKQIILPKKNVEIDKAYIITTRWSENYHHWLNYVIPKLKYLNTIGSDINTVVVNRLKYPFQKSSLEFLGPRVNVLEASNNYYISVNEAIIPESYPNIYQTKLYFNSIFHTSYNENKSQDFARIYVSRSYAKKRRILNEEALIESLKLFNFKIIHLEKLSFNQQISLFNNAQIIISAHGAGLTNLYFAKKGSHIIEILPHSNIHDYLHYFELASNLELNYYAIRGEKNNFKNIHSIHLNINLIVDILNMINY